MELKVSTYDKAMIGELSQGMDSSRLIRLSDDVDVKFEGVEFKKGVGFPEIAAFIITVGAHVPAALAADIIKDWIISHFQGRSETITINDEEIIFSKKGK